MNVEDKPESVTNNNNLGLQMTMFHVHFFKLSVKTSG